MSTACLGILQSIWKLAGLFILESKRDEDPHEAATNDVFAPHRHMLT